jgi:hypothetical protein
VQSTAVNRLKSYNKNASGRPVGSFRDPAILGCLTIICHQSCAPFLGSWFMVHSI